MAHDTSKYLNISKISRMTLPTGTKYAITDVMGRLSIADEWVTSHTYAVNDYVWYTNNTTSPYYDYLYICKEAHTSDTFITDLSNEKWAQVTVGDQLKSIQDLIPSDATSSNQLADKAWVNANGGKIDTITVNGTTQTITNKNAEIPLKSITNAAGTATSLNASGTVTIDKSFVGLGSVVNTGDSATPVSGGTTKFTTGGAYTELNKKLDKTDVVANYTTTATGKALDATKGKDLNDRLTNLESRGRYLSTWNSTTGKPDSYPEIPSTAELSYTYEFKTGDYYIVSVVGSTKLKPSGDSITATRSSTSSTTWTWTVGTATETGTVAANDTYIYSASGTSGVAGTWTLVHTEIPTTTWSSIAQGNPLNNTDLDAVFDSQTVTYTKPTGSGSVTVTGLVDGVSTTKLSATASGTALSTTTKSLATTTITGVSGSTTAHRASAGDAIDIAKVGTTKNIPNVTNVTSVSVPNITANTTTKASYVKTSASKDIAKVGTTKSIPNVTGNATVTFNAVETNTDVSVPVVSSNDSVTASYAEAGTAVTIPNITVTSTVVAGANGTLGTETSTRTANTPMWGATVSDEELSFTFKPISTATLATVGSAEAGDPYEITPYSFSTVTASNTVFGTSTTASKITNAETTASRVTLGDNISVVQAASNGTVTDYTFDEVTATNTTLGTANSASAVTLGTAIEVVQAASNGTITPYTFTEVSVPVAASSATTVATGGLTTAVSGKEIITAASVGTQPTITLNTGGSTGVDIVSGTTTKSGTFNVTVGTEDDTADVDYSYTTE